MRSGSKPGPTEVLQVALQFYVTTILVTTAIFDFIG